MIEKNALIHPERPPRRRRGQRAYIDPNAAATSALISGAFDEAHVDRPDLPKELQDRQANS